MIMAELFKELFNIVSFQEALILGKHVELMMPVAKSSIDDQNHILYQHTQLCRPTEVNQSVFHN